MRSAAVTRCFPTIRYLSGAKRCQYLSQDLTCDLWVMSGRGLMYVVEFSGTNGDPEVRKSTLWTPIESLLGVSF
jgi:hypothetical protein